MSPGKRAGPSVCTYGMSHRTRGTGTWIPEREKEKTKWKGVGSSVCESEISKGRIEIGEVIRRKESVSEGERVCVRESEMVMYRRISGSKIKRRRMAC